MRARTKLAAALAAIGLAVGMAMAETGTARAGVTPPVGQYVGIFNPFLYARTNTLCFDDPGGSTSNGVRVQLYHCHPYASDGAPQRWVFIQAEDPNGNFVYYSGLPVYSIYNLAAGRCLAVTSQLAGTPPILVNCSAAGTWWQAGGNISIPNQFLLSPWPLDPPWPFYNGPRTCVAADNFSDASPTPLKLATCDVNDTRQLWSLG
jgi:hypothetical protein